MLYMVFEKNLSIICYFFLKKAWIFEAIPAFGEIVGGKKKRFEMPRFMRYIYVKDRGYPTTEQIKEVIICYILIF